MDTIKPPIVLASGDLTDARDNDHIGARQYVREWQIYNDIVTRSNVQNKTYWMDIKGNHGKRIKCRIFLARKWDKQPIKCAFSISHDIDNFNVPISMLNNSYFHQYSVQGFKNRRSYMKIMNGADGKKYAFIAVDSSLPYGLKRPFNFIGVLTSNDTANLQKMANDAKAAGVDYTIWFGHYPTSCIVNMNRDEPDIRQIIGGSDNGLAYLCGHLHTLGGMVPNMYALHDDKFLELEVADWKSCRKYRVVAIDGGLLSFADVDHGKWPIVLVTNPKHALFHIPNRGEAETQRGTDDLVDILLYHSRRKAFF